MSSFFYPSRSQGRKLTTAPDDSLGPSQFLYDEVIRKNHEMIKALLIKISDVYNRQEQYEQGISNINLRILDLTQNNKDLHHEMRANQVEAEQKYQVLINEVKAVKSVLKIPDPARSYEDYLSSGFFKEQSSLVTGRTRTRKRNQTNYENNTTQPEEPTTKQHTTVEFSAPQPPQPQNSMPAPLPSPLPTPESNLKVSFKNLAVVLGEQATKNVRSSLTDSESLGKSAIKESIQQFEYQMNALKEQLSKVEQQNDQKLAFLKEELREQRQEERRKLMEEMEDKSNWSKLDFLQLQKYLDKKIKEQLGDKINKHYFQESLNNLKESWEEQLQQLYTLVNNKIVKDDLTPLQEKITDILNQLENITNLNSLKIQNISYTSTCKSTPFRVNLERNSVGDQENNNRVTRQSEEPKHNQNHLKYCNSLSLLRGRPDSLRKTPRIEDNHSRIIEELSAKKWKERAQQTLGLSCKKVRRRGRP